MAMKVLVTGTSVRSELLQPLASAGYRVENPTHLLSEAELREQLRDTSAYLLGGDEIATRVALESAHELKVIAFLGVGYESFIDVGAAKHLKIAVTNTPGTLTNSVAEYAIGLVLNSTRRICLYASQFAQGEAGKEEKQRDLANLTVGVVGLGSIGTRIAEIVRTGFGSKVIYHSRTRKTDEEKRLSLSYGTLDEVCSKADVLVVMTPGNDQTKHLIGRSQVHLLRAGSTIVNPARPEIVDPAALLSALKENRIGYAAFDGFYDEESATTRELRALIPTKLLVTGHIASLTHDARDAMARKAVQSILNILQSGKDINRVA